MQANPAVLIVAFGLGFYAVLTYSSGQFFDVRSWGVIDRSEGPGRFWATVGITAFLALAALTAWFGLWEIQFVPAPVPAQ